MKISKITFATLTLLTTITASFFTSSCQKESLTSAADEPALFTKDVVVADKSGRNTAVIRLSSTNESLLGNLDFFKAIEIEPVFEAPSEIAGDQTPAQEDAAFSGDGVQIEIISQQLEQGAIGLNLRINQAATDAPQERAVLTFTFITSYDHIKVKANVGCHNLSYYRQPTSNASFIWMATFYNVCPPWFTQASSVPSYRMKAVIAYNPGTTFTITAW